jgi:hypothetical protein
VRPMLLLWLLAGGICGACSDPARSGTVIGVVSGVLAGMFVLSFLGLGLGLVGARVLPTAVGGCFGALFGILLATIANAPSPFLYASFGIITGGLIGGTVGTMLSWMTFVLRFVGISSRRR